MADNDQNQPAAPAPAPAAPAAAPEGFLHSIATSLGIDPEAVRDTTRAVLANPHVALSEISSEAANELKDAATHPLDTLKQTAKGVVDQITNPEAADIARARYNMPGLMNKAGGVTEEVTSAIPLVGGNLVKAEEQGAQGNVAGSLGTIVGTVGPDLLEEGARRAPEAIHEAGAQARENMAARREARVQEARTGKVIDMPGAPKELPEAPKALPAAPEAEAAPHITFEEAGGQEVQAPIIAPDQEPAPLTGHERQARIDDLKTLTQSPNATEAHAARMILQHAYGVEPEALDFSSTYGDTGGFVGKAATPEVPTEPEDEVLSSAKTRQESPLPESYNVSVRDSDGTTHDEQVQAYHPQQALDKAQEQFPTANGWAITDKADRSPSGEYTVPTGKMLSLPKNMGGISDLASMRHELGHAMVGQNEGLTQNGVVRHTHPMATRDTAAAVRWKVPAKITAEKMPGVLRMFMGGIAADEAFNNIPRTLNRNFDLSRIGSDGHQGFSILKELGYSMPDALDLMHKAIDYAKDHLTQPAVSDVIRENASVREPNLSRQYHYSPERLSSMHAEALRRLNAKPEPDNGPVGEENTGVGQANVPSGEGEGAPATGQAVQSQAITPPLAPGETLEDRAVKAYGVTDQPEKMGYILPDGRGLDFSQGNKYRVLDHGDVSTILPRSGPDKVAYNENPREVFTERTGAVRLLMHRDGVNIVVPSTGLTTEQGDVVMRALEKQPGKVTVDIRHRGKIGSADGTVEHPEDLDHLVRSARRDAMRPGAGTVPARPMWSATKTEETPAIKTKEPDEAGYVPVPADSFFMFSSPTEAATQKEGFKPGQWNLQKVQPNEKLQASAQRYAKAQGMPEINHAHVEQSPARGRAVAQQYHEAEHAPENPRVKVAYDTFKAETKAQFHHLRDDLGLKFEPQEKDPYGSAQEMMNDVRQNNRLKVFSGSGPGEDHPLSEIDPETGETYNTLFRWVHDAYGHAAGGNDFSENGEKSATEAHAQMYSPLARPAMRAETEGQTSWFFHNPDVESGAKQPGEFAPQKATLIPDEAKPVAGAKTVPAGSKFVTISPEDYRAELDRSPRVKDFLQDSAEQLRGDKLFKLQTPDGKDTGIAYSITPDGELRGLVNNGPFSGASELAIKDAFAQGATHTQHSWDLNGRIANLYRKIGGGTVISEPYDEKTYGPPSDEMKAAWKKAGWKEGTPYPHYTQYVANRDTLSAAKTAPAWHETAANLAANNDAGAVNPVTGKTDSTGIGVEILPEMRQPLNHVPTAADFKKFYSKNKDFFDSNPEMRVGWDNNSGEPGGHEINVGAVGPGAPEVARKLDQIAAFDIAKGENIPTGGTGKQTQFPDYSLAERMRDLRGMVPGNTISTRYPWAKKITEDPMSHGLALDRAAIFNNPKLLDKYAERIKDYPGFKSKAKTSEGVVNDFIDHVKNNLKWIYDQVPADEQVRNREWYDGANKLAVELGDKHGFTTPQTAGVIASLSPQKDWNMNVSLAQRLTDIVKNHAGEKTTPEMLRRGREIVAESPSAAGLRSILKDLQGKRLGDLQNPRLRAMWVRLYDETYNPREYDVIGADGSPRGQNKNLDGTPSRVAWGGLQEIQKAMSILADGSRENISESLGRAHKVRHFYNNIIEPNSPRNDVTVDTHAVAAGLMRALSGFSPEVIHNFGRTQVAAQGIKGTYPLYLLAYQEAAKDLDIPHARQLQSVVWEKIRNEFPSEFKTPENQEAIDKIWKEHTSGKISGNDARERIFEYAQSHRGTNEGARNPSDQGQLFGGGVPGESAEGNRPGTGRGDTGESQIPEEVGDTSFDFGHNVPEAPKKASKPAKTAKVNALDFLNALGGLKEPGKSRR